MISGTRNNALLKRASRVRRRFQFRRALSQGLRSLNQTSKNGFLESIRGAIRDGANASFSPEQHAWFNRIELRRKELLGIDQVLQYKDYGAGNKSERKRRRRHGNRNVKRSLSQVTGASKSSDWGTLLHSLVVHLRPSNCVEMGTCVGISASYIGAALSLSGRGRLVTLEGAPPVAAHAEMTFKKLGLDDVVKQRIGQFKDTLPTTLEELNTLDFIFIDGHHERDATIAYYEQVLSHLQSQSLVVFDDISWSPGMRQAWEAICEHPRTHWALDLGEIGLVQPAD